LTAANRRGTGRATPSSSDEERQAILRAAFRADLTYWIQTEPRIALKIMQLVDAILRNPFTGMGKPEPLRHTWAGAWSRRITGEHRIVYEVNPRGVLFNLARGHYSER
jgi:toxin YoeB